QAAQEGLDAFDERRWQGGQDGLDAGFEGGDVRGDDVGSGAEGVLVGGERGAFVVGGGGGVLQLGEAGGEALELVGEQGLGFGENGFLDLPGGLFPGDQAAGFEPLVEGAAGGDDGVGGLGGGKGGEGAEEGEGGGPDVHGVRVKAGVVAAIRALR